MKNLNLVSFNWELKVVKSMKEEIVSSFVQGLTSDAKLIDVCVLNRLHQNPSHKFLYSICSQPRDVVIIYMQREMSLQNCLNLGKKNS